MPGKLIVPFTKNQLLRRARCPRANKRPFTLHASEDLFPALVTHILERDGQWLIEINRFVEQINRALRLALFQPLLAESGAERQHLERAKIAPAARDHELHRAEVHVRLHAVKRHVPEIGSPPASASSDRGDRLLVALLQLAQRAIGVRREQSNEILVQRYGADDQSLQLQPDRDIVLAQRAKADGNTGPAGCVVRDGRGPLAGGGGRPVRASSETTRRRHDSAERPARAHCVSGSGTASTSSVIASSSSTRPSPVCALNGITCSLPSASEREIFAARSSAAAFVSLSFFVNATIVGTSVSARKSSIARSSSLGSRLMSSNRTIPRSWVVRFR